ncbi:hypothetical protein D9Q98_005871 [Chlorella vulgaris]|uniref:FAM91 C-terminal domain-containing protein n=1 Tax=Chlorella vulgaris TaxID=3077 RepID=A0A9D4Z0B9_CHLVU|nr:hypothetical protein D9Q98_005871 [Chlorella vulgaris]
MPPPQAFRILSHSYGVVLPITSLAFPPLPLSNARPASPVNYGPLPAAQTPWLQLLLYTATGSGPLSLVLAAGQQLRRLPSQLHGATHVLLWPWDAAAVRVQNPPVVVEAPFLLHSLNEYLQRSALLVPPLDSSSNTATQAAVQQHWRRPTRPTAAPSWLTALPW